MTLPEQRKRGTEKTLACLRFAEMGRANYATDLALVRLQQLGYWELVGSWSRLTAKGVSLLAALENRA